MLKLCYDIIISEVLVTLAASLNHAPLSTAHIPRYTVGCESQLTECIVRVCVVHVHKINMHAWHGYLMICG